MENTNNLLECAERKKIESEESKNIIQASEWLRRSEFTKKRFTTFQRIKTLRSKKSLSEATQYALKSYDDLKVNNSDKATSQDIPVTLKDTTRWPMQRQINVIWFSQKGSWRQRYNITSYVQASTFEEKGAEAVCLFWEKDKDEFPGKLLYFQWSHFKRLYSNCLYIEDLFEWTKCR